MFTPKKLLIIRLSSIGDVLLTTPLIRVLNKKFPACQVDFVIKRQFAELINNHPGLNKIYLFDKAQGHHGLRVIKNQIKHEKYDIIIDVHKNFRSLYLSTGVGVQQVSKFRKYIFNRWLLVNFKINLYEKIVPVYQRYIDAGKILNLQYDNDGLDIFISSEIKNRIAKFVDHILRHRPELIVGFAPGASLMTKRWPVEKFIEVARFLIQRYQATIILFGDNRDRQITSQITATVTSNIVDVAGTLSLQETAALMDFCDVMVTNDTGLMHLATALKKKIIAIFGSTTEHLGFFPVSRDAVVIQNEKLGCRPCSHIGRNKCPRKHLKCLKDIQAKQVMRAIENYLSKQEAMKKVWSQKH